MCHLTKKYKNTNTNTKIHICFELFSPDLPKLPRSVRHRKSIKFDGPYFDQLNSLATDSPLRPVLVNTKNE